MSTTTVDGTPVVSFATPGFVLVGGSSVYAGSPAVPASWPSGNRDQLIVCSAPLNGVPGVPLMELRGAVVESPSWVLNGIGRLRFSISSHDPALLECLVDDDTVDLGFGELSLLGREVEWWRNGELRWKGVPVAADVSLDGIASFDCFDLGWYLSRRFMGAAQRKDLLSGIGQMDTAGLPGWSESGSAVSARNTSVKVRGSGSAQVAGAGAIVASFVHPPLEVGQDLTVLLSAMVRVPSGLADEVSLVSITAVPTGSTGVYRPGEWNTAKTSSDTPRGGWSRQTAVAYMRPGVSHTVTVTLWSQGASSTYFDDVRAMKNDTTGIPSPGSDLAQHIVAIVNHAQDGRGKGSFGFTTEVLSDAGTVESLGIRHLEHTQILDLIADYTEREDGIDWWIDPRTRRFCIAHRKGTDRTDDVLHDRSVMSGGWVHDESERASSVVVLGEGSGVDRPEGGYSDETATAGLVLDLLHRPANGTPLAALDPMARQVFRRSSQRQVRFGPITVPGSWWGTRTETGDRHPVEFRSGVLTSTDLMRVGSITHDLENDVLELV